MNGKTIMWLLAFVFIGDWFFKHVTHGVSFWGIIVVLALFFGRNIIFALLNMILSIGFWVWIFDLFKKR